MVPKLRPRRAQLPKLRPRATAETDRIRNSRKWKRLSKLYRLHHPVCEACGENISDEVHHRQPISKAPHLAHEWANLMALCKACHREVHGTQRYGMVALPDSVPPRISAPLPPSDAPPPPLDGPARAAQLIG
jgi:5-methylcytosine-specific restriction endonuclease McrA